MRSKTTEEQDTINNLLKTCKGNGLPWDLNKSKLYFVSPHAHVAVIVGAVEINRTADDTWEIKSRGILPRDDQWQMSHAWFEKTEVGRRVNRLMQEVLLYQQVDPSTMYVQYPNSDLRPANRITKEKGKTFHSALIIQS